MNLLPIKNYKLTISYNGFEFCGWAIQNDERTVQGELQSTLSSLLSSLPQAGKFIVEEMAWSTYS